ncbi:MULTISPECIES: GbsR/MarR family transcriptional regulator [unclassified Streptomyces]|uniref:GbsR/MarR family transcriptional regulator n=1 Tax=unclassified Streptomyces TaxID=2593676 RepID=UPI00364CA4CF
MSAVGDAGSGSAGSGGAAALIEDFGLHIGQAMGWPRMAGRTAGVLMTSRAPLTLAQLMEALGASKGSMSETTRLLITNGTVERYKPTGSRQFVFRWRDDAWVGCLQHQLEQTAQLHALAERAQGRAEGLPPEQRQRVRRMVEYYAFMTQRLEVLLAEFTASQAPEA